MKKPVLLLFSIFLIITSCNKDDDTNSDNSPQFNELGLQGMFVWAKLPTRQCNY